MMPPDKENQLFDIYQEQQSESEKFWARLGKCLGYLNKKCPKCSRVRLEKYESGDVICEKCGWNDTTKAFEPDRY
jgi:uncharacterized Zn finger protein (UPF0148 family)